MTEIDNANPPSKTEVPNDGWLRCGMAAFAGAGFYGLADGAAVIMNETVALTGGQEAILMLSDAVALGLFSAILLLPIQQIIQKLAPNRLQQPAWTLFLSAMAWSAMLDLAENWFTDPPPFTEAPPLHGNVAVFIGVSALLAASALLLGRWVPMGRPRLITSVVLCGSLMVWSQSSPRFMQPLGDPKANAPNVLLITLDTTRADHFGAYGNEKIKTPHFDKLAQEGVLFEQAMAQIPVTGPSHTTILSGQGPWTHGGLLNGKPVSPDVPLLTETLRSQGYRTGAFLSAYVLNRDLGLARGFEVYDDDFGAVKGWTRTLPGRIQAAIERRLDPHHVLERRGEVTVDQALAWLNTLPDSSLGIPFFGWVHLFDPHGPYEPPSPWDTQYYDGDPKDPSHTSMQQVEGVAEYLKPSLEGITDVQWVLDQYAGEISYTDAQIGRLLEWLEQSGHADNTLVIVVGDHGESLGEHGVWFNHGDDLFEPSIHVPLVLKMPQVLNHYGDRIEEPVELTDLVPTIHDLLQLAPPSAIDGESLEPMLLGGVERSDPAKSICFDREANVAGREAGIIENPTWRMVSLRQTDNRFVWREAEDYASELYLLSKTDIGGFQEDSPEEISESVRSFLESEAKAIAGVMSAEDVQKSNESELDVDALEALGYVE